MYRISCWYITPDGILLRFGDLSRLFMLVLLLFIDLFDFSFLVIGLMLLFVLFNVDVFLLVRDFCDKCFFYIEFNC